MMGKDIQTTIKHILLAEDDLDDQMLFEEALGEVNEQVILFTVKDGVELLERLKQADELPDLLVLDLNMPLKDGFECLEEIRASPQLQIIPVVICSTSSDKRSLDLVYDLGANYYLCKPNSFSQLKEAIAQVLTLDFKDNVFRPSRANFVLNY